MIPTRRHHVSLRLGAAVILFCVLAVPADARQRDIAPPPDREVLTLDEAAHVLRVRASDLERLARRNQVPARRIARQWRFNRHALMAWLNGDWTLITTAMPPDATPLAARDMGRITGMGTSIAQGKTEAPADEKPATGGGEGPEEPIGEAPKERTAEEVFLREQKLLLEPGKMTIDTGLFYSKSDTILGTETQTFTTLVQGRIGIMDETQLFASTTFSDQNSDAFVGSRKVAESGRTEFGAVNLGVRRTLLKEGPGRPNIIATVSGSIPTGETSYAVGGGLAFVKSIDPVVLFASTNYRHAFSRDFSDTTRLEAEDRFSVTLGYALALNDTLTLSTSLSGVFSGATRFPSGAELRQQDSFSMQFGFTSWLAKGLYIEPSVSFGLEGPTDSVVFGVTVPYTF